MKKQRRGTPPRRRRVKPRSVAIALRGPGARIAELVPAGPLPALPSALNPEPMMVSSFVGTLKLTGDQIRELRRKVDEDELDWKPMVKDGPAILPYLSHNGYRDRLDAAFGLGGWGMFQTGVHRRDGDFVYIPFALIIDGLPRVYAWGEQQIHKMTLGDALEGAKSNAIVRCGKELGIARELWNKRTLEQLQAKRRGGGQANSSSAAPAGSAAPSARGTEKITEPQQKRFFAIAKKAGRTKPELAVWLAARWNVKASADITRDTYNQIVAEVEAPGVLPTTPAFTFEGAE